jgi:nucleoside-diphosphate-sugar epimerase
MRRCHKSAQSPRASKNWWVSQYTRLFHQLYGMQRPTLRYLNLFWPRMATIGAHVTVIGVFLRLHREGKPFTIDGDSNQFRDSLMSATLCEHISSRWSATRVYLTTRLSNM